MSGDKDEVKGVSGGGTDVPRVGERLEKEGCNP